MNANELIPELLANENSQRWLMRRFIHRLHEPYAPRRLAAASVLAEILTDSELDYERLYQYAEELVSAEGGSA